MLSLNKQQKQSESAYNMTVNSNEYPLYVCIKDLLYVLHKFSQQYFCGENLSFCCIKLFSGHSDSYKNFILLFPHETWNKCAIAYFLPDWKKSFYNLSLLSSFIICTFHFSIIIVNLKTKTIVKLWSINIIIYLCLI